MRRGGTLLLAVLIAALGAACGGSGNDDSSSSSSDTTAHETTTAPSGSEDTTTLPAGATAGLDDYNQDGQPDPICATGDFKAGLVLRIPCNAADYAPGVREGTTLVPNSLYALPGLPDELKDKVLTGASADAVQGRDESGKLVYVLFIQSDTLFEVGSSKLSDPARDTLNALANNIKRQWPTASVQVRGHTDSTGSASANQTLSEQRAKNVADYLATQGIDRSRITSVGLGPTVPIVLEKNPDGSDNPEGRRYNRRVELVVRPQ